jgi:predicted alpha/beta-hydrolase family hydrolase
MTSPRTLAGVSVAVSPAPDGAPAVLLGHGAGSDYREPLLAAVRDGVAARGYLGCSFNFRYREQGRRLPDRAPALEECVRDVAAALRDAVHPPWLVLGGKSMGGRIASQVVAHGLVECRGLLFLGYPLHPPGKPERLRTVHLADVRVPMLFVSGTRDALARRDLLEEAVGALGERARLHLIPEGDHSLAVPKRTGRTRTDVWQEAIDVAADWLRAIAGAG